MKVRSDTGSRWLPNCWAVLILLFGIFSVTIPLAAQRLSPSPEADDKLSVDTELVTFNVSVTNRDGLAISGLEKKAFVVFDNQKLQEVSFFSDEDAPVSVSIVFDTSGSMSEKKIIRAKEALARFIRTSREEDEFFLIGFDSEPAILLDGTRDADAVLNKLRIVETRGNTALYDAIGLGLNRVRRGAHLRKVVIVISDGEDNNSRLSFGEIRRRLRESEAMVYTVGIRSSISFAKGRISPRSALQELASVSGGKSYFPDGIIEMDEAFEKIALELRHLYSIGYYPADFTPNGNKHRLKIKLNVPKSYPPLVVRSRKIYYAGTKP